MSQRIYRSALGKPVDMGSLLLKNEEVRAVGNMGVNAKGDVIDKKNTIVNNKNTRVNNEYRKQIQNQIVDVPPNVAETNKITQTQDIQDEVIEGLDDNTKVVSDHTSVSEEKNSKKEETTKTKKAKGGLASAIAKAREIEQKKLRTPREEARSTKGVKKI